MKKLLALFLTVVLLMSVFSSFSVFAKKTPTFVISTAKGDAGDKVKITISTDDNTGIISMKLLVKYDSSALKLIDSSEGKFEKIAFSPLDSNPFVMNWIDAINPNNKTNGTVATLTFKILDTAPEGKSEISLTYDPEDVFDSKFQNVKFEVKKGYVDIKNPNAGAKPLQNNEDTTSDTMNDTTTSQLLEQIQNAVNKDTTASQQEKPTESKGETENSQTDNIVDDSSNVFDTVAVNDGQAGLIIWIVIALAVILLVGSFAVVIINSKKKK